MVERRISQLKMEDEIRKINLDFHSRKLLDFRFYKQIMNFGILFSRSTLFEIYPDGEDTYCGELINQKGELVNFDISLEHEENSIFEIKKNCKKSNKIEAAMKIHSEFSGRNI